MPKIESFVILDFETTGIEREARVTEIAFIAVSREHILSAATKAKGLPRVMNKFIICLQPGKPINPIAAKISGLNNDLLRGQRPFDKTAFNILENFVCRFPQPVCFIAHNGDTFDFPILQAELEAFKQKLPDYVLCADSMKGFKAVLGPNQGAFDKALKLERSTALEARVTITQLGHCPTNGNATTFSSMTEVSCTRQEDSATVARTGTKRKCTTRSFFPTGKKCSFSEIVSSEVVSTKRMPSSFKLDDIYRYFFERKPQNNHTAHGDAQNLLECIIAAGNDFLCWTDGNARKLNDVKSRWSLPPNERNVS